MSNRDGDSRDGNTNERNAGGNEAPGARDQQRTGQSDQRAGATGQGRGQQQGDRGTQQGGQQRGQQQRGQQRQRQQRRGGGGPGRTGGQSGGIDFGDLPWKSGVLNGLLTFVAAFIGIGVLLFVDVALSSSGSPTGGGMGGGSTGDALFYAVGWLFYNAHFVDVAAGGQSVNLLSMLGSFSTIPTVVYYAVPAGLLVASGRSVGGKSAPGTPDGQRAANGASILAGYLPLAAAGSFVFTMQMQTFGATTSIGPKTTTAVLIAGLAYPVIFGGLGGYLSG